MSSESNSGSGGQNLSNDDFDVMVDMGYGRKMSASKIAGAVGFSGAKVQLSESGAVKFQEAAIKDAIVEIFDGISNEYGGEKTQLSADDVKKIYDAYPKHDKYDTNELYELVGGALGEHYKNVMITGSEAEKKYWENTCATRLSYAFNTAEFFIPQLAHTWKGANNLNYYVSSQHMFKYLDATYLQSRFSPISTTDYSKTIKWGVVAHSRNGRVDHVDVIWREKSAGLRFNWDFDYLFGGN